MIDEMYILHAEHTLKAKPYSEPVSLAWSVHKHTTIADALAYAKPKDDSYELTKCWIEVRMVPRSMR